MKNNPFLQQERQFSKLRFSTASIINVFTRYKFSIWENRTIFVDLLLRYSLWTSHLRRNLIVPLRERKNFFTYVNFMSICYTDADRLFITIFTSCKYKRMLRKKIISAWIKLFRFCYALQFCLFLKLHF